MIVVQVARNLTKDGIPKAIVEPEESYEKVNQSFQKSYVPQCINTEFKKTDYYNFIYKDC